MGGPRRYRVEPREKRPTQSKEQSLDMQKVQKGTGSVEKNGPSWHSQQQTNGGLRNRTNSRWKAGMRDCRSCDEPMCG